MRLAMQGSAAERNEVLDDMKHGSVKFAMFQGKNDAITTHLFGTHHQHSHYVAAQLDADDSLRLLGAGFVRKGVPEWGSESCRDEYGYDRPENSQEAGHLIDTLRSALVTMP